MLKIEIFTNDEKTEFAIAVPGDQVMRAATIQGIIYPVLESENELEAQSDLAFIDENIQEALRLHIEYVDNCSETDEFECCNCLKTIESNELHAEIVLYAGEDEIGMVAAMHNECGD